MNFSYVRSTDYQNEKNERSGGLGRSTRPGAGFKDQRRTDRFDDEGRNDRFDDRRRNDRFDDRGGNGFRPRQTNSFYEEQQLDAVNWDQVVLKPLNKNFYKPSEAVLNRPKQDIEAFYRQHDIKVKGKEGVHTVFKFDEVGFPSYITDQLAERDFSEPTVIQSMAWPTAMAGRDLVGIAQTGSGK